MQLVNDRESDEQLYEGGKFVQRDCGGDLQRLAKRILEFDVSGLSGVFQERPSKIKSPGTGRSLLEIRDLVRDRLDNNELTIDDIDTVCWYRKRGLVELEDLILKV